MKILIAGGLGFIGANLSRKLSSEGHDIFIVDDLSTGRHVNRPEGAKIYLEDICNFNSNIEFDQIYNLACPASPPQYQSDPLHTLRTNTAGVVKLLEIARECGATFLQASTSEVYGDPIIHPQTEGYWGNVNPIGPRSCYDEGKRVAETYCYEYFNTVGVNVKIARIFNTYGPFMDPSDGRVVSNFICQALKNEPITVYGDGYQTRSFCYVDDTVDGLISLMNIFDDHFMGPVNIGNPKEITVKDAANIIIRLTESNSKLSYKPLPINDPIRRKPDIELAKDRLKWSPKTVFEIGLKQTIRYFKEELKVDE